MRVALSLALRYLRRHARLALVIAVVTALMTTVLASLPTYATVIAMRSLRTKLDDAPAAARNLTIMASRSYRPNPALLGDLLAPIDDLVVNRLDLDTATLATTAPYTVAGGTQLEQLTLTSLSRLSERVRLVDGRWPAHWEPRTRRDALGPPQAEALVGTGAAGALGIHVGDVITATPGNVFTVVGTVEPQDPRADIWFDDLARFEVGIRPKGTNTDYAILPLILPEVSLETYFPFYAAETRIVLNHSGITVDRVEQVRAVLATIQNHAADEGLQLSSGLDDLLDTYTAELTTARITLYLLTAQAAAFALYTLTVMALLLRERSQAEIGILVGRGAGPAQTTFLLSFTVLAAAVPAAVAGPPLGRWALRLMTRDAALVLPDRIPTLAWLVSAGAAAVAWGVVTLTAAATARSSVLDLDRTRARPAGRAPWQRFYLDLFFLALGGLAYWQLRETGGAAIPVFDYRIGTRAIADPILLLGPSLLLIAVALVFLRIFPVILRGFAGASRWARGLVMPLGFARLARAPQGPGRVVLLISLAMGLALFAQVFGASVATRQAEIARYQAGADLRLAFEDPATVLTAPSDPLALAGLAPAGGSEAAVPGDPTVASTSLAFRTTVRTASQDFLPMLAVDSLTFARVARFPAGVTQLTMDGWMSVLQPDPAGAGTGPLPAIVAYAALPASAAAEPAASQNLTVWLMGEQIDLQVRGMAVNFPTVTGAFIVVDRTALLRRLDVPDLGRFGTQELWLALQHDDARSPRTVWSFSPDAPAYEPRGTGSEATPPPLIVLADASAKLRTLQGDTFAQSVLGAFRLNALALVALSLVAFLIVHYFSAEQRTYELSILRASGTTAPQVLGFLVTEGVLAVGLGLVCGTAIGFGLSALMLPSLSQLLATALAGHAIVSVVVDRHATVWLYGTLIGSYGIAMGILLGLLWRAGVHRALRVGDN